MSFLGDGRKSLGHIISERGKRRLEYFAQPSWFDGVPEAAKSAAYCTQVKIHKRSIDKLNQLGDKMIISGYEAEGERYRREADRMASELAKDTRKLGLSLDILDRYPVCVYRLTESGWHQKTTREHEAFHAKVRNLPDRKCAIETAYYGWDDVPGIWALLDVSKNGWATPSQPVDIAIEEIMARLEETRKACVIDRSKKNCGKVKDKIHRGIKGTVRSKGQDASIAVMAIEAFDSLAERVKDTGPIGPIKNAAKACQTGDSE